MELLKNLCSVHATSGDESKMTGFLLNYIKVNQKKWKVRPVIISGDELQESIILAFGKPRTAIFAHIDSIGFTVRYGRELVRIGGPDVKTGYKIWAETEDQKNEVEIKYGKSISYKGPLLPTGTALAFSPDFRETEEYVQCCYLDNRLGVYSALKVAETLTDGIIVFSCREEHMGGSASYLASRIYNDFKVRQALISDITWVTKGVHHGKGTVISLRDSGIPRRVFVNRILEIAKRSELQFQVEVEAIGGSDGTELQKSSLPVDWCFIGAPESNVHSPDELVYKNDIQSMIDLYKILMKEL